MKIILPILTIIIIWYTRKRLLDQAFSQKKTKLSLSLKIWLNGIFLVWLLFLYQIWLKNILEGSLYFANNFTIINIWIFITYCSTILLILTGIHKNLNKKYILRIIWTWAILFITLAILSYFIPINTFIIYFIISAYAEEYLKFTSWNNFIKNNKKPNDLLFFCFLIWLGFSSIENTLYAGNNLLEIIKWWNWNNLILARWLTSTLIHIISTGIIWYITLSLSKYKINIFFTTIIAFLWWLTIHTLYNISIFLEYKIFIIIIIICSYFLLTYLLFQTDLIFTHNNKKISQTKIFNTKKPQQSI